MIDVVLISVLIFAILYGSIKGFMSIVDPIISFLIAIVITPMANIFLLRYVSFYENGTVFKIILFLFIYIIIRFLISKIKTCLKKILNTIYLGWLDYILGALTTLITASILTILILNIITEFTGKTFHSKVLTYILNVKDLLIKLF